MRLDLSTLLWVLLTTSLVLATAVLVVYWRSRSRDGLAAWGWGLLLHGLSYPAFALRFAGLSDTSILLTNLLSSATIALHTLAVMQFQGARARSLPRGALWGPVLVATFSAWVLLHEHQMRNAMGSVILGVQALMLTWLAWGPGLAGPRERGRLLLTLGSTVLVLALVARAALTLQHTDWDTHVEVPPEIQGLSYLVALVVVLVNTIGFVLMQKEHSEQALFEGEQRYRKLIESANEGICIIQDGVFKLVNQQLCHMIGYTAQELLEQSVFRYIDPSDQDLLRANYQKRLTGQADQLRYAARIVTRDGSSRWWELGGVAIDWHGQRATLNFTTDITERRATEEQLRLAANVFTHANEGIILTDAHARIINVNDAFCRITGYARDEAVGQTPRLLHSGRHDANFYRILWQQLLEKGFWQGEIWNRHKNGDIYAESLSIRAVPGPQGTVHQYVALFTDITDRKKLEEEIHRLAYHDPLTNLPNRRLLVDRLHMAIAAAQRNGEYGALMFIDLDNFKTVNDSFGHEAGDALLMEVAHRLLHCIRESDTVARFGGDEFVAMFPMLGPDLDRARQTSDRLAHKIQEALALPHKLAQTDHHSPGSIGIALFQAHSDPVKVMQAADQAMYQAKAAGRDTYVFNTSAIGG